MNNNFEAKVRFGAEDTASPKIDSATQKILKNYRVLRQEQRAVRAEFELNNRALVDTVRFFGAVGNIANSVTSIYTKYNIMQLRIGDANRRVREAEEDYQRVLAENGPGTESARRAARELAAAKEDVARAENEARFGAIGFLLEFGQTASLIIQSIPKFKEMIQTLKNIKTAADAAKAASAAAGAASVASSATSAAAGAGAAATGAGGAAAAKVGIKEVATTAAKAAAKVAIPVAVVETVSMLGSQQAGETPIKTGFEAILEIGQDILNKFTNSPGQKFGESNRKEKLVIEIVNKSDQVSTNIARAEGVEVLESDQ